MFFLEIEMLFFSFGCNGELVTKYSTSPLNHGHLKLPGRLRPRISAFHFQIPNIV